MNISLGAVCVSAVVEAARVAVPQFSAAFPTTLKARSAPPPATTIPSSEVSAGERAAPEDSVGQVGKPALAPEDHLCEDFRALV